MGNEQSTPKHKVTPAINTTTPKMNSLKRTNEEAFPDRQDPHRSAPSRNLPIVPVLKQPQMDVSQWLEAPAQPASRREAELEEQLTTTQAKLQKAEWDHQGFHRDFKSKTDAVNRLGRENQALQQKWRAAGVDQEQLVSTQAQLQQAESDLQRLNLELRFEMDAADLLTQESKELEQDLRTAGELEILLQSHLTTTQAKLQQAESDVQGLKHDLKFEMDSADRLAKKNIELEKKLKEANNETGVMQALVQEEQIRGDKLEAANRDGKAEMDKVILRAEKAEFQARVLGQQVQKEKDMADQLEAAALDARREKQYAEARAERAEARVAEMKGEIQELRQEKQEAAKNYEERIKALLKEIEQDEESYARLEGRLRDIQVERAREAEYSPRAELQVGRSPQEQQQLVAGEPQNAQQQPSQEQNLTLSKQEGFQNREQLHVAYEQSLATAEELIALLQTTVEEKETQIREMQARERELIADNQSLETSNADLLKLADELQQIIDRKCELVKDALAEVKASAAWFEEEFERNGAAEKELREMVEASKKESSQFEKNLLYWISKSVGLEEKLKRCDEHRDLLLEQIKMSEEQGVSDDERASDEGSISSCTEPGSSSAVSEYADNGLMDNSDKRWWINDGERGQGKDSVASPLERLPQPRKRAHEEDAAEQGPASTPTKRRRHS